MLFTLCLNTRRALTHFQPFESTRSDTAIITRKKLCSVYAFYTIKKCNGAHWRQFTDKRRSFLTSTDGSVQWYVGVVHLRRIGQISSFHSPNEWISYHNIKKLEKMTAEKMKKMNIIAQTSHSIVTILRNIHVGSKLSAFAPFDGEWIRLTPSVGDSRHLF